MADCTHSARVTASRRLDDGPIAATVCTNVESTHPDQAIPMTDDTDPNKLKGPGGLTLRQIHEQVQKSVERDRQEQTSRDTISTQRTRWQRWVRYVWGRTVRR